MKSCTVPLAYGVERFAPNLTAATIDLNAVIFQDAVACDPHWRCTSSIWVASYTPAMSMPGRSTTSASVPRMGPDVITGEQMRIRFCAVEMDLAIACTSLSARPGQKYGRTSVPSASVDQPADMRPEVATTGFCQSSSKLA